jgi:hypothetical protein
MKITNIRLRETNDSVSLLADCKIRHIGWDTMYFTVDKKYKDFLYEDASPFAAALLIPAMYLGEDIVVEGSFSRKLHSGMKPIMDKLLEWKWPVKRAEVKSRNIIEDAIEPRAKKVATFFSGGVDSFYTFLKHKDDEEDSITHLILVNGNDIDLRNKKLWEATKKNVQDIADKSGVELITVETNTQLLLEPILSPELTHGGSLAAVGLALRGGLKKVYIPSSFSAEENVPYGSHGDLDKYWSSESISFEHDGAEVTRFQKIEQRVSQSPLALEYLRVCYLNKKGTYNCGRCEKCLRTMLALYAVGKLEETKTLPHKLDFDEVYHLAAHSGPLNFGLHENLRAMKARGIDPPLQKVLADGLAHNTDDAEKFVHRWFKKFQYVDHMYFYGTGFKIWVNIAHRY